MDSDELSRFSSTEELLGLSTYLKFKETDLTDRGSEFKGCEDKVRFIYENSKCWKKMNV